MDRRLAVATMLAVVLLIPSAAEAGPGNGTGSGSQTGSSQAPSSDPGPGHPAGCPFKLSMTPEEMCKVMYVQFKETKRANLTVKNIGSIPDTAHLDLAVEELEPHGWIAILSNSDINLEPGETKCFSLTVTGPSIGSPNDYIEIDIYTYDEFNPSKTDNVTIRCYSVRNPPPAISCAECVHTIGAGTPTDYSLTVKNILDFRGTLHFSCNGPPNWTAFPTPSKISGPFHDNSVNLTVTVIPPEDAMINQVGVVSVMMVSDINQGVKASCNLHAVISCCGSHIQVGCAEQEAFIDSGHSRDFRLTVSNYGNMAGAVAVFLDVEITSGICSYRFEPNFVTVAGGEAKSSTLSIYCPRDARPDRRLVRIKAFTLEGKYLDDTMITVLVGQALDLRVSIDHSEQRVRPGETAIYTIKLDNSAMPFYQDIDLGINTIRHDWPFQVWPRVDLGVEGHTVIVHLGPREVVAFILCFAIPVNASCGEYRTPLNFRQDGGGGLSLELTTTVEQEYDVSLSSGLIKIPGSTGDVVRFPFEIANHGNGPDQLRFEIDNSAPGWNARVTDAENRRIFEVYLLPGETSSCIFEATVPCRPDGLDRQFNVTAVSASGISSTIRFTVDIWLPDLVPTDVAYLPRAPRPGQSCHINITIANNGFGNASRVYVSFRNNSRYASLVRIDSIPAGASQNVTFAFKAEAGRQLLEISVDPDDLVQESNERNNQLSERTGGQAPPSSPFPSGVGAILAVMSVYLSLATCLAVSRSRSRAGRPHLPGGR